ELEEIKARVEMIAVEIHNKDAEPNQRRQRFRKQRAMGHGEKLARLPARLQYRPRSAGDPSISVAYGFLVDWASAEHIFNYSAWAILTTGVCLSNVRWTAEMIGAIGQ